MIPHLPLLFSILTPLENAAVWLLDRFHYNLGLPWAWAIVGTTVVVRIALVPLTIRQIHSMQNLQRHAPEMKEIQRKYKADKQKLQEEMMKFYRENHINPAASCLPLVAQFPVFISLYLVLKHFEKNLHIRGHTNLSWLHFVPNITAGAESHWSGIVLLVVYVASQMSSTYFMSQAMDKTQRRLMLFVPLLIVPFIGRFKVGLVLYWVTTNLWTVGQGLITRRLIPRTVAAAAASTPRRSSRTPPAEPPPADAKAANGGQPEQPQAKRPPAPSGPRRVKRRRGGARR